MSLDLETRLKTFLASAPQTIHSIACLEISHSAMTKSYNLWRETVAGGTYVAGVAHNMEPVNFDVKLAGSEGHLDQRFSIAISTVDSDDTLRDELDRIPVDTAEKIKITYREFLSDDLLEAQATAVLQAESISYVKGAANISAVSPRYNSLRTGENYDLKSCPTLRGFL